jgi:hypothetical protein
MTGGARISPGKRDTQPRVVLYTTLGVRWPCNPLAPCANIYQGFNGSQRGQGSPVQPTDAPSDMSQYPSLGPEQVLRLDYPEDYKLYTRYVPKLPDYYALTRDGDEYTALVDERTADDVNKSPLSFQARFSVPVDSVNQIPSKNPTPLPAKLRVKRGQLHFNKTCTPEDGPDRLLMSYDPKLQSFAHSATLCTTSLQLEEPLCPINGAEIVANWTVDPLDFPSILDQMNNGEELVLSPSDIVSDSLPSKI